MSIKRVTANISVSPQLAPSDLDQVQSEGFKTIINNRPDGEEENQPKAEDIAQTVKGLAIEYHYQPVISSQITDQNITDFADLLDAVQGPVLAFCRTGTRCISLWALTQAGHLDIDDIIATAQTAGYDLSRLRPRLLERAAVTGS